MPETFLTQKIDRSTYSRQEKARAEENMEGSNSSGG
jgi:hypothetical protein